MAWFVACGYARKCKPARPEGLSSRESVATRVTSATCSVGGALMGGVEWASAVKDNDGAALRPAPSLSFRRERPPPRQPIKPARGISLAQARAQSYFRRMDATAQLNTALTGRYEKCSRVTTAPTPIVCAEPGPSARCRSAFARKPLFGPHANDYIWGN